jgi:hypothetical protein
MALLLPKSSSAQASYAYSTRAPEVTAATADWQVQSSPIIVGGIVYFPTRAFRLFDANVMTQTGVYGGVPIYSDVTIEPYSIVYVPVSTSNMRVYERRREGDLAGTAGSRTPSFPVEIAADIVRAQTRRELESALLAAASPGPAEPVSVIATSGTASSQPVPTSGATTPDRRPSHTRIEVIPRPAAPGPDGVWLEFAGARWYAGGAAVPFTADRFEPIGDYRGFAVYREKQPQRKDEIWVSVVKDGPVAPYARR